MGKKHVSINVFSLQYLIGFIYIKANVLKHYLSGMKKEQNMYEINKRKLKVLVI